ncbi:dorsal-ventral patterning tolloid-like protein 1 [Fundulus heteroclitus]|uniref:dorsal-ventral patterning tolloid-like protein 1 n=1 Tax=Fundulus heteroclitus TaxID=8078 RepID=UPI00165C1486|nr:dorsal-ventral patterning tolloid-like protein 1 [Fundulus heteroclitus]
MKQIPWLIVLLELGCWSTAVFSSLPPHNGERESAWDHVPSHNVSGEALVPRAVLTTGEDLDHVPSHNVKAGEALDNVPSLTNVSGEAWDQRAVSHVSGEAWTDVPSHTPGPRPSHNVSGEAWDHVPSHNVSGEAWDHVPSHNVSGEAWDHVPSQHVAARLGPRPSHNVSGEAWDHVPSHNVSAARPGNVPSHNVSGEAWDHVPSHNVSGEAWDHVPSHNVSGEAWDHVPSHNVSGEAWDHVPSHNVSGEAWDHVPSHNVSANASAETLEDEEENLIEEGDIIAREDRNAVNVVWSNAIVPYEINPNVGSRVAEIQEAFRMISAPTCIRFVEHTNELNYISIRDGKGCASPVGVSGGSQSIYFAQSCSVGNLVHELIHALGLYHEHTRDDRDQYITINWPSVVPDKKGNFKVKRGNTLNQPYDYESIMHYGPAYFSVDGSPTIVTNTPKDIGQRTHLSSLDIKKLKALYHC